MDNTIPAAIPWWQSRIIWTQIIGFIFGTAATFGFNLNDVIHLDQATLLAVIMAGVLIVTTFIRVTHPVPAVTGSKAAAQEINVKAGLTPEGTHTQEGETAGFNAEALKSSASKE